MTKLNGSLWHTLLYSSEDVCFLCRFIFSDISLGKKKYLEIKQYWSVVIIKLFMDVTFL